MCNAMKLTSALVKGDIATFGLAWSDWVCDGNDYTDDHPIHGLCESEHQ